MKKVFLLLTVAALALVACDKHTHRQRQEPEDVVMNKPSNWTLRYEGRETYTETDGSFSRVEHFSVSCPGVGYYILRTIAPEDYRDLYKNNPRSFFEEEAKYLREDAFYYNENVTDYFFYDEYNNIMLDRFASGTWLVFVIGFDRNGFITGSYAETTVTIAQETPTKEYEQWIGEWTIGAGGVTYPISIEQDEANYSYIVRGWETGESINPDKGEQMDKEYIRAEFGYFNDNLYFVSQWIGNYEENSLTIDENFLGKVDYQDGKPDENGIYIVTETERDLAAAIIKEGGSTADVIGCDILVSIGDKNIQTAFCFMQYIAAYEVKQNNNTYWEYSVYNDNVPALPLTMVRTRASVTRPALEKRPSSRASVHHNQPRAHGEGLMTRAASQRPARTVKAK